MDTFWGHHKLGLYLGDISVHFRIFYKVKVQNREYFFKISNFFGVLETPDIFLGERKMLSRSLHMKKKMRV